jgi:glucosylceramidase
MTARGASWYAMRPSHATAPGRRLGLPAALALLLGACSFSVPGMPYAGKVQVHVSSAAGDRLAARSALSFGPHADAGTRAVFAIDDGVRHQKIAGFGASFLEAGLVALDSLPRRSDQDAVLRALFDPRAGAGFSAMKTPIGATDFQSASPRWYTYDDVPGDVSLSHFSIARDLGPQGVATFIKRARQAGGRFVLQAPMDYPPDWMLVDLQTNQNVDRRYYQALADYYVKYVRAYESHGIHIDYVSPFNEPGNYTKISPTDIRDFIRDYLGPTFARERLSTRIQLSEAGGRADATVEYPPILDDPGARRYIAVVPYHGYDWDNYDALAEMHARYPDIPIWMTELCCLHTQAEGLSFESGAGWADAIISDLEAGASAWIHWNAILDENGGPWLASPIHADAVWNAQESVVVVDRVHHTVTYTGLYYYLAHFSRFVRPGATRLGTTAPQGVEGLRAISFQNADGTLVSELVNSRDEPADVQVDWRGRSLTVTLPAVSITTLQWPG